MEIMVYRAVLMNRIESQRCPRETPITPLRLTALGAEQIRLCAEKMSRGAQLPDWRTSAVQKLSDLQNLGTAYTMYLDLATQQGLPAADPIGHALSLTRFAQKALGLLDEYLRHFCANPQDAAADPKCIPDVTHTQLDA